MSSIRRVLIVQPYGIGDLLFVTPVLRALRLQPTVEKVDLLLGSRTEAVVRSNPHVDEIFTVDKDLFHRQGRMQTMRDLLALGGRLRKNRYDLMLDYSLRSEYAFFGKFLLGIPRRAGFGYKQRGWFHSVRFPLPGGFRGRHVTNTFCDLAEAAGIPVEDRFLEFYVTDAERQDATRTLRQRGGENFRRFVIITPGGGESWGKDAHFKRWPVPFFAELVERLKDKIPFDGAVILGSAGEKELAAELAARLNVKSLNLAGEITLPVAAALLEKAAFFVGNDGGLVHLAHALRIPLIAFYGPVDPVVYGPYPETPDAIAIFKEGLECRPCYQNFRYQSDCSHRNCLQALTPDEVFNLAGVSQVCLSVGAR